MPGPRTIDTMGSATADREVEALWRAIDTLHRLLVAVQASPAPGPPDRSNTAGGGAANILVQETDGDPVLIVPGIEFGDDFQVSQSSDLARIDLRAGMISLSDATPAEVASAGVAGFSGSASRSDHVHRGVAGIKAYTSGTALHGTVILRASGNIEIQQDDVNNIVTIRDATGSSAMTVMRSTDYGLTYGGQAELYVQNPSRGAVQLPSASDNRRVLAIVRNTDISASLTVLATSGETIEGNYGSFGSSTSVPANSARGWIPVEVGAWYRIF